MYTLGDAIVKLNVVTRQHLQWKTPYFKWFGHHYDFYQNSPSSRKMMAHNLLDNQTKIRDNSPLHYYIGPTTYTKQGFFLYNRKTK